MGNIGWDCHVCNEAAAVPILFGCPTHRDFDGEFVHGGEPPVDEIPTHYCLSCGHAWAEPNCHPIIIDLPTKCCFCGEVLSPKDQFVFQNEYDAWIQSSDAPFLLEEGIFDEDPMATCGQCRTEIKENRDEMKADEVYQEFLSRLAMRIIVGFLICFVITLFAMAIFL